MQGTAKIYRDIRDYVKKSPQSFKDAAKWINDYCIHTAYWERETQRFKAIEKLEADRIADLQRRRDGFHGFGEDLQKIKAELKLRISNLKRKKKQLNAKKDDRPLHLRASGIFEHFLNKYDERMSDEERPVEIEDAMIIVLLSFIFENHKADKDLHETDLANFEIIRSPWASARRQGRAFVWTIFKLKPSRYKRWTRLAEKAYYELLDEKGGAIQDNTQALEIEKRFRFVGGDGQVFYKETDLQKEIDLELPAGRVIEMLSKLVKAYPELVLYKDLGSLGCKASPMLKKDKLVLNRAFKEKQLPLKIDYRTNTGYLLIVQDLEF